MPKDFKYIFNYYGFTSGKHEWLFMSFHRSWKIKTAAMPSTVAHPSWKTVSFLDLFFKSLSQ